MGQKEPLADDRETTGMCGACFETIKKEIERNAIGEDPGQREADQGMAIEGIGARPESLPITVGRAKSHAA